ncbi:O-methyltransferase [Kitasatospora sp. NPDC050463]|uniref:O-methyltransferase n=1 Tax=Kitasatospora sp. NPDC050463 TaxID=3155786 RepID=UPI00340171F8
MTPDTGRPDPQQTWTAVDTYFNGLLVEEDAALLAAVADSEAAGLPPHQVAPNQGKLLSLLARVHGARRVLEIGTLGGYSTIWLARALPEGGRLVTLEADEQCAAVATCSIERAGLAEVVELRTGRALDTLPQLEKEGGEPFDLVFIDADKPSNPAYLEWALRLTRPGSLIIGDNVVRDGAVTDGASTDPRVQGVRRFTEQIAAHPRLTATAVQTVGEKGYDGFVLALVTG